MKIAILMGIVLELLGKNITASKLAEKFEISTRTVYRYIETLCQSGVPIVSLLGKNGGFFVNENFCLKNLFLTTNEIDELLAILKDTHPLLVQKLKFAKKSMQKNNTNLI